MMRNFMTLGIVVAVVFAAVGAWATTLRTSDPGVPQTATTMNGMIVPIEMMATAENLTVEPFAAY
jgi:hypothetical protein